MSFLVKLWKTGVSIPEYRALLADVLNDWHELLMWFGITTAAMAGPQLRADLEEEEDAIDRFFQRLHDFEAKWNELGKVRPERDELLRFHSEIPLLTLRTIEMWYQGFDQIAFASRGEFAAATNARRKADEKANEAMRRTKVILGEIHKINAKDANLVPSLELPDWFVPWLEDNCE